MPLSLPPLTSNDVKQNFFDLLVPPKKYWKHNLLCFIPSLSSTLEFVCACYEIYEELAKGFVVYTQCYHEQHYKPFCNNVLAVSGCQSWIGHAEPRPYWKQTPRCSMHYPCPITLQKCQFTFVNFIKCSTHSIYKCIDNNKLRKFHHTLAWKTDAKVFKKNYANFLRESYAGLDHFPIS